MKRDWNLCKLGAVFTRNFVSCAANSLMDTDASIIVEVSRVGKLTMSSENEIKRLMGSVLGTSVLACSLAALPIEYSFQHNSISVIHSWAKDGDSGEGSGSGSSGESGESGCSSSSGGSGESGESGNSGKGSENSGKSGENGESRQKGRNRDVPDRFGKVVRARNSGKEIEIRYSDGWREEIKSDRYRLKNQFGVNVISRVPRESDWLRMKNILQRGK